MTTFTIHEAKTNLSRLIAAALRGEEVVVARGKTPVVKIVALPKAEGPKPKRPIGWLAHTIDPDKDPLADGFWDDLPDDHLGLGDDDDLLSLTPNGTGA